MHLTSPRAPALTLPLSLHVPGFGKVVVAVISVAAKMEEQERDIPPLSQLVQIVEDAISTQELQRLEIAIMDMWDWNGSFVPCSRVPLASR